MFQKLLRSAVLWILAHCWSNEKMRVTPIAFSLVFIPFQILFMGLTFGSSLWGPLLKALILAPAALTGAYIRLKIGERISKEYLRILDFCFF